MAIIQGNAKQGSTRGFYPKTLAGSLRFNDDDVAYLSWTPDSAGNRRTWTFSCWVKRGDVSNAANEIFGTAAEGDKLAFGDSRIFWFQNGSASSYLSTSALFRDPSAWYHIVFALDTTQATAANRCKLWVNGVSTAFDNNTTFPTQNYEGDINNTEANFIGRGHSGDSGTFDGYLAEVFFIDGQALTADDFGETKNGVWVAKDYAGTFGTNGFYLTFEDDTQVEAFNTVLYRGNGSGNQSITGMGMNADLYWIKRRDAAGGWNCVDTVRGPHKRLELHSTGADYNQTLLQSFDSDGFTTGVTGVGESGGSYVAFGWDAGANNAVTGHSSVTYTGNGGTQKISGFPFSPDLVWIKERNGARQHHWYDSVRGATKVLYSSLQNAESTNSTFLTSFDSDGFHVGSDIGVNGSGQNFVAWAWDAGDSDPVSNTDGSITSTVKTNGDFSIITYTGTGPATAANEIQVGHGLTSKPDFVILKRRNSTGDWFVFTDIIDGSNDYLYLNQTAAKGDSGNSVPTDTVINLGGSLNTSGGTYVAYAWRNVTGKQKFGSYSGTGSDVTVNVGFRPGFLLVKWTGGGGASAENWAIVDASRDPINNLTKGLFPNTSGAEQDSALNNEVEFTSTGFVVKNTDARWNANGGTYIYAAFAGSYSDYITDYNTDGSIDSRVKASDTTGFSMVSYTGTGATGTVGHGLSSAPNLVIVKNRDASENWRVQSTELANNQYLTLNATDAASSSFSFFNNTFPTSTVFSVGAYGSTNGSGQDMIAYCWTETTGYSKFGSYNGDSTTDGSHEINVGFKPAMVIIKHATGAYNGDWFLYDNTRDVPNGDSYLRPNLSSAETANGGMLQLTDTGFAFYTNSGSHNQSGFGYIYAAFADTREAAFWLDQSGNDNDWQPVNLDHNDTVADSPTNNFCTLNPLNNNNTLSNGNLRAVTGINTNSTGTMAFSSGQHYFEVTVVTAGGSYPFIGLAPATFNAIGSTTSFVAGTSKWVGNGGLSNGDVVGIAFDLDTNTFHAHINGTYLVSGSSYWDGSGMEATVDAWMPCISGVSSTFECNFGQQPFKYDPPA